MFHPAIAVSDGSNNDCNENTINIELGISIGNGNSEGLLDILYTQDTKSVFFINHTYKDTIYLAYAHYNV